MDEAYTDLAFRFEGGLGKRVTTYVTGGRQV